MSKRDGNGLAIDVPLLGMGQAKVGSQLAVMPRSLDASGLLTATVHNTPQGPRPVVGREQYLDADQLLAAIREVIREEIAEAIRLLQGMKT